MQDEQQGQEPHKDTSPAQPVDGSPDSASVPPSETPATPAHEEAQAASGQPDTSPAPDDGDGSDATDGDVAPDADEPGDDSVPEELEAEAQSTPDQPDEVDQES